MRQTVLSLAAEKTNDELVMMPLELIDCASQVRTFFNEDALHELANDIVARGVLQPVLLRPYEENNSRFLIVAGERRVRAARLACLTVIPALISKRNDVESAAVQLAENIQREELSLWDTAKAIETLYTELGNLGDVAARCKKSKSWVSKRLALSNGLESYAAKLLEDGITEDLELLKAVSDLVPLTTGTDTVWALCEKIRNGTAGRKDARKALAKAKDDADPDKRMERKRIAALESEELERIKREEIAADIHQ